MDKTQQMEGTSNFLHPGLMAEKLNRGPVIYQKWCTGCTNTPGFDTHGVFWTTRNQTVCQTYEKVFINKKMANEYRFKFEGNCVFLKVEDFLRK